LKSVVCLVIWGRVNNIKNTHLIFIFNKYIIQKIMKNNQNKLGFSLIELSIVILVIGLLVLGITKGSTIIKKSKITSAQSLTRSSPVASIDALSFWIESTMDNSFEEGQDVDTALGAAGTIDIWNDINPQETSAKNAIQNTPLHKPRYIQNGINGLPSVNFDGNSDVAANADRLIVSTVKSLGMFNSDHEIFIVYQTRVSDGIPFLLAGAGAVVGHYELHVDNVTGQLRYISAPTSSSNILGATPLSPHIASARVQNNTNITRVDGVDGTPVTLVSRSIVAGDLLIGVRSNNTLPLEGDIGEIIIFDRALKVSEREDVEKYLSAKWGIKLQ
jgi:prepilin-type N-terminal cleavage/methylation domain-containing protein